MKKKGYLQKTSLVMGVVSEFISLICLVMLVIKYQELGVGSPITASFLASTFFFFCCGIVLIVVGRADLPSLGFDNQEGS